MVRTKKRASRQLRRSAVVKALMDSNWSIAVASQKTGEQLRFVRKWKMQWQLRKTVADNKRSGRKKVVSKAQKDAMAVLLSEHQSMSKVKAILVEQHGLAPSTSLSTLYRAAKEQMELSAPVKQPLITAAGRSFRVTFANQELGGTTDWNTVMAIDSTYFTLNGSSPRRRYWVMKGHKAVVHKPNKSQQLHVYGGICAHGKTPLFFVTGTTGLKTDYKDSRGEKARGVGAEEFQQMLEKELIPAAEQIFSAAGVTSWSLLMDKAPAHNAKATREFMADKGIKVIENWPGNSLDLNPIENAWGIAKQEVYSQQYSKLEDMKEAAIRVWDALPTSTVSSLMLSIPRRLQKVHKLNGGYTGY